MQRPIKFRAWDKDTKEMEIVGAIDWDEHGKVLTCNTEKHKHYMTEPNQFVLMQYTGLRDKNGVEIYEGDIANITLGLVEKGGYTERGVMEFNIPSAQFSFLCRDSLFEEPQERPDAFKVEVIGNIYENPELLNND